MLFYIVAILFAIAAVGGATLGILHFSGKKLPLVLALAHGAFAASGLVLLIVGLALTGASVYTEAALVLFILAAIGGFILFALGIYGKPLISPLVVIHGLAAVVAFILLLIGILRV
jgi:hypothetical protein